MSNAANSPLYGATRTTSDHHDVDELFTALASERRRAALAVLGGEDAPVDVAELARGVAAAESDAAPATVTDDRIERVRVTLYHVHLPKLADAGLVEFDPEETTVAPVSDALDAVPL